MPDKKLMEKLFKSHGGAVVASNIHLGAVQTHSPSLNFIFGNGWGLPKGHSLLLYGNPGGGKSLILRSMIGKLHQSDPEAVAIIYDTEFRWLGQVLTDPANQILPFGIDISRLLIFEGNRPDGIFDHIEQQLPKFVEAGINIGLIGIDSITNIQGRRATEQKTIMTMQRGDHAATLQDGLKVIHPIIRKYHIPLVLTTQIRDEQDPQEIMKKKKIKPAAGWAAKHFSDYVIYVQEIDSQAGRKTLSGKDLQDLNLQVFRATAKEGERIGHRIRARMVRAAMGPKNRVAEFTIGYGKGFINQYEEALVLGSGTGAVERPNARSYIFGDREWGKKEDFLNALQTEPDLCEKILQEVHKRDLAGTFKSALSEDIVGSDEDIESDEEEESSE
jgi:RecA/RadA recombinase